MEPPAAGFGTCHHRTVKLNLQTVGADYDFHMGDVPDFGVATIDELQKTSLYDPVFEVYTK